MSTNLDPNFGYDRTMSASTQYVDGATNTHTNWPTARHIGTQRDLIADTIRRASTEQSSHPGYTSTSGRITAPRKGKQRYTHYGNSGQRKPRPGTKAFQTAITDPAKVGKRLVTSYTSRGDDRLRRPAASSSRARGRGRVDVTENVLEHHLMTGRYFTNILPPLEDAGWLST